MANNRTTDKVFERTDGLNSPVGGIKFKTYFEQEPNSTTTTDKSYTIIQHILGSFLKFFKGSAILSTQNDLSINVRGNKFESTKGTIQKVTGGSSHEYVHGDKTHLIGEQSDEHIKASQDLQDLIDKEQKEKMDAIKNGKEQKVPCPVCNATHLSSEGTTAPKIVRTTNTSYFPFSVDTYSSILGGLSLPVSNKKTNYELKGGSCGSAGCVDGEIVVKTFEEANKAGKDFWKK